MKSSYERKTPTLSYLKPVMTAHAKYINTYLKKAVIKSVLRSYLFLQSKR